MPEKVDSRRKYQFNFDKIEEDSQEKYYWLGFLAGDGSVREKENRLRIELGYEDREHLVKFKKFMESDYPIFERYNNNNSHCVKTDINSAKLRRYLANYNIIQNKTENFIIPLEKIPQDFIFDYMRGFMDADGCISIRNRNGDKKVPTLSFCAHKKECLEQIREIIQINNTISSINNNYFLIKEGKEVKLILDKFYKNSTENSRLTRKYNIYCSILE